MKTLLFMFFLVVAAMATGDENQLKNLLYDGNNKFTARLTSEVAKTNKGKSYVLSAFSVLTPLAQLALASVGDAAVELFDTIGMPNDTTTKEVFSLGNSEVRAAKGITLNMASKIYIANSYELNCEFAQDTRNTFGSEVESMNFLDSQNAANEINTWVEEQTNNHIKDLVDPDILTADTRALLVNAIYFKGFWKNQFDERLTRDSDFYVNKDVTKQVRMMTRKGDYRYAENHELDCQIIEIPYEGEEASMLVFLPRKKHGINEVEEKLQNFTFFDQALQNLYSAEVELKIPQFKIETTTDLKESLINMNVKKMFSPETAHLDKLLDGVSDLFIDSAKQKAFMEVNEKGAEGAAANVFGVSYATSLQFEPEVNRFTADHPFVYYVRVKNIVIFNGAHHSS